MKIEFEISDWRMKDIDKSMEASGVVSRQDHFNNALTIFEWAIEEVSKGRLIASVDEENKKYSELVMPALTYAKNNKAP